MSLVVSSVWPALPTRAAFPACFTASNFCFLPLRACLLPGLSKPTGQASPPPTAHSSGAETKARRAAAHHLCRQLAQRRSSRRASEMAAQQLGQRAASGAEARPDPAQEQLRPGHQAPPPPINLHYASGGHDGTRASLSAAAQEAGRAIHQPSAVRDNRDRHTRGAVRSHRGLLAALLAAPVASTVAAGAQAPGAARGFARDRLLRRLRGPSQEPRSPRRGGGRRPAAPPACSVRPSCEGLGPPPSRAA